MTSPYSQHRIATKPPSTAAPRRDPGAPRRDPGAQALRVVVALAALTAVLAPMAGNSGPLPVILVDIPFAILAARHHGRPRRHQAGT